MTPPRAARALRSEKDRLPMRAELDAGHAMMSEQPDAVLDTLFAFALSCAKAG